LVAYRSSGHICFYFGNSAGAHDHFQKTIELYDQARHGGAEESRLAGMRRGLAILREQGMVWLVTRFEAALAEAEASAGETDAGLRRLDDALAELERTEQRWYEAEVHRIRGEILLQRDPANTTAAEHSLQTAIAIAQSQKARSFELRAALALAKLYRAANRDADAHAVLAPVVEGFPPTQQFPELAEAQELLAALSPRPKASASST
jgi:predicted ATPase